MSRQPDFQADFLTDLLDARDRRQRELDRVLGSSVSKDAVSFLFVSANIPGPDKHRPGTTHLLSFALDSLQHSIGLKVLHSGRDLLGPFHIASSRLPAEDTKKIAVALEAETASARLLDVDVYRPDGSPVDRRSLALAPRLCLLCMEPARECILLRRHSAAQLLERVDCLLQPFASSPHHIPADTFATNLRLGLLRELDLTPKPGLVDREDNGSHPDLSYERMRASAELLRLYWDEILSHHRHKHPFRDFVQAGIDAEKRMMREVQSNAHKGFIFLSGVALMAVCQSDGHVTVLRRSISKIAADFFAHFGSQDSHGMRIRDEIKVGGIRAEAEQGLPAVFEHGWPKYREALKANWNPEHAGFYLMAVLMQRVEDTTAIHRCGLEGLARIRRDGARIQRVLEQQQVPEPILAELNREYRKSGLTMGGVADCMALIFALQESSTSAT